MGEGLRLLGDQGVVVRLVGLGRSPLCGGGLVGPAGRGRVPLVEAAAGSVGLRLRRGGGGR